MVAEPLPTDGFNFERTMLKHEIKGSSMHQIPNCNERMWSLNHHETNHLKRRSLPSEMLYKNTQNNMDRKQKNVMYLED